jgi:purine-cytosine permease-like protein
VLIICYAALVVYLITHYTLHTPKQTEPMQWGAALTTVLSFSLLAWTYKISTVSRFAVPADRAKGPSYFMAASTGIMLAVLVMGVAGTYSDQATGDWNIALLGAHISGWGFVAALGVALAVIHTNAMNLYPSTVDLLVALNTLRKPRAWEQPVATVILGIGGILLAWAGILSKVQTFLDDAGNVIISFTFVMLADWLFFQRRRDSAGSFYDKPSTVSGWISWQAVVAFAVGVVIAFQGQHFLPSFCYETLPLSVLAGLVAAALDVLLSLPKGRARQSR